MIPTKLQNYFSAITRDSYFYWTWFSVKWKLNKSLPHSVDQYFAKRSVSQHFSKLIIIIFDLNCNFKLQLLHSKNSGCAPVSSPNDIANLSCAANKNMPQLTKEKKFEFFYRNNLWWNLFFGKILVSYMILFCHHIEWHLYNLKLLENEVQWEKNAWKNN